MESFEKEMRPNTWEAVQASIDHIKIAVGMA
jgi:hypothetical protein